MSQSFRSGDTAFIIDNGLRYFKSFTGACQPCNDSPAVGMSVGLLLGAPLLIFLLYKCVVKRLGKWARRRMRAFGKITFVFVQIMATLPQVLQMPLPPIFAELMEVLKIPALDLVFDNLGLGCVVDTDHFVQLVAMTMLPPLLVVFVFIRNVVVTSFNFRDAAARTTGPAIVIVYVVFPVCAATIFDVGESILACAGTRTHTNRHTRTHSRARTHTLRLTDTHAQTFKTESFADGSERLLYDLSFQVTDRYDDKISHMNEAHF